MEEQPGTTQYRNPRRRPGILDLMSSNGRTPKVKFSTPEVHEDVDQVVPAKSKSSNGPRLGWIQGVFIPVLLNIWGVILFLRLGWVVGQAGIWGATGIVILANAVTSITAFSLSAICTNGEILGGGPYYLISRSLGPSFGGSIGILFFIGQSIAAALYVLGFAESLTNIYKLAGSASITSSFLNDQRMFGAIICVVLLCVSMVGVSWYAKTQSGLLVILLITIVSVIIGAFLPSVPSEPENADAGFVGFDNKDIPWSSSYTTDLETLKQYGFFTVFAVFFPAATGITAGANMSGDLRDASSAIPKGTLAGIGLTFVSYIILLFIAGATCLRCVGEACMGIEISSDGGDTIRYAYGTPEWASAVNSGVNNIEKPDGGLAFNPLIMLNLSVWGPLVYIGVFAATLSSALASMVGAPRILQAVARDRIFPWKFIDYFSQDVPGFHLGSVFQRVKCIITPPAHQNRRESTSSTVTSASSLPYSATTGAQAGAPKERKSGLKHLFQRSRNPNPGGGIQKLTHPHTHMLGKHEQGAAEDIDAATVGITDESRDYGPVEPRRGYILTFVIAVACALIGDLNVVAPLISNFFMLTYALINFACFRASMSDTPGWRPSFKFYNQYVSLLGAVVCIVLMFAFDWITALVSLVVGLGIYKYLDWHDPPKDWGPASDASRYVTAMRAMYKLRQVKTDIEGRAHVKTFRPSYLLLVKDPRSDVGKSLISFICKLYKGRGMCVIAQILEVGQTKDSSGSTAMNKLYDWNTLGESHDRLSSIASQQRRRNQRLLDRAVVSGSNILPVDEAPDPDDEGDTVGYAADIGARRRAYSASLPAAAMAASSLPEPSTKNTSQSGQKSQGTAKADECKSAAPEDVSVDVKRTVSKENDDDVRENQEDSDIEKDDNAHNPMALKTIPSFHRRRSKAHASLRYSRGNSATQTSTVGRQALDTIQLSEQERALLVAEAIVAPEPRTGLRTLIQVSGLGPLRPNTVVFGFPEGWQFRTAALAYSYDLHKSDSFSESELEQANAAAIKRVREFEGMIFDAFMSQLAVLIVRDPELCFFDGLVPLHTMVIDPRTGERPPLYKRIRSHMCPNWTARIERSKTDNSRKTIDIWWLADEGGLAILVPYLMRMNPQYAGHRLRVFTTGTPDARDNDATIAAQERSMKLGALLSKLRFETDAISLKLKLQDTQQASIDFFHMIYPGFLPEDLQGLQEHVLHSDSVELDMQYPVDAIREVGDDKDSNSGRNYTLETLPVKERVKLLAAKLGIREEELLQFRPDISALDKDMKRQLVEETRRILRSSELIRNHSSNAEVIYVVPPYPRKYQPPGLFTAWVEMLSANSAPTVLIRGNGGPVVTFAS